MGSHRHILWIRTSRHSVEALPYRASALLGAVVFDHLKGGTELLELTVPVVEHRAGDDHQVGFPAHATEQAKNSHHKHKPTNLDSIDT